MNGRHEYGEFKWKKLKNLALEGISKCNDWKRMNYEKAKGRKKSRMEEENPESVVSSQPVEKNV